MKSIDIIRSYQSWISWGDECEIVDLQHIWKDFCVMRHENSWYVPYFWNPKKYWLDIRMFTQLTKVYALDYGESTEENLSISVIFGGEMTEYEIEKIYSFCVELNICPFWENVKSEFEFTKFLLKISDGVDWNRTFCEFNPENPKIFMEWDS